jgi:hypothetical protein
MENSDFEVVKSTTPRSGTHLFIHIYRLKLNGMGVWEYGSMGATKVGIGTYNKFITFRDTAEMGRIHL